jgi:hypothetical protein
MTGWLMPLAGGVGFHKPIAATASRLASPARASSPPGDQGGSIESLMEGVLDTIGEELKVRTPQSRFDVVGWIPSRLPPPPPFGSATASGFAVRRVQSADADDCGRPAFLLEPPSGHPLRPDGRHRACTSRDAPIEASWPLQTLGGPW